MSKQTSQTQHKIILRQYSLVIVNLDPTQGHEIRKTRPCLVISPNEMNIHLQTLIIAPITSQSKSYPSRINIDLEGVENWIILDQIRTIDRSRVLKNMGKLSSTDILRVKAVLQEMLVD